MWKNSLSGLVAESHANASLVRRREAYAEAIKFYEEWMQTMHSQWDLKHQQTLLLQPHQRTLPAAAYKQTLPMPDGITDSQVRVCFPACRNTMSLHCSIVNSIQIEQLWCC